MDGIIEHTGNPTQGRSGPGTSNAARVDESYVQLAIWVGSLPGAAWWAWTDWQARARLQMVVVVVLGCCRNSQRLHLPKPGKQPWQRRFLITLRVLARGSCTRTRSCSCSCSAFTGCASTVQEGKYPGHCTREAVYLAGT